MEIKVNEIINWVYNHYKDEVVNVHHIKKGTLDECFRSFYDLERSSRYDNARHYEFVDPSLTKKYWDWKQKNETILMYYGNGVVD